MERGCRPTGLHCGGICCTRKRVSLGHPTTEGARHERAIGVVSCWRRFSTSDPQLVDRVRVIDGGPSDVRRMPSQRSNKSGFNYVREAMRSWGIACQEDLSWLRRKRFPVVRLGNPFSARAQGHILALLEAVFVMMPQNHRSPSGPFPRSQEKGRDTGGATQFLKWNVGWQMGDVDLHEVFLLRISMLKICLFFAATLRKRHRAKSVGDIVPEERAWKLFGLRPLSFIQKSRRCGPIERDELNAGGRICFRPDQAK